MKNYIITTYQNHEYTMPAEDALELIEAWKGSDKSFPIELDHIVISSASIRSIEPKAISQAELVAPKNRQIDAGKRCRGQYSIQNEINRVIFTTYPKDWSKRIKSSNFREAIRQKLLAKKDAKLCDYKTDACNCEATFLPHYRRHEVVV